MRRSVRAEALKRNRMKAGGILPTGLRRARSRAEVPLVEHPSPFASRPPHSSASVTVRGKITSLQRCAVRRKVRDGRCRAGLSGSVNASAGIRALAVGHLGVGGGGHKCDHHSSAVAQHRAATGWCATNGEGCARNGANCRRRGGVTRRLRGGVPPGGAAGKLRDTAPRRCSEKAEGYCSAEICREG